MKTKTIPFDIELAKKIQSGEIEGRIVTDSGILVRILCFDRDDEYQIVGMMDNIDICLYTANGDVWEDSWVNPHKLYIELPEETPKQEFKVGDLVRHKNDKNHIGAVYEIIEIEGTVARLQNIFKATFMYTLDGLELVKEKKQHDFKPFDKVLVRGSDSEEWIPRFYSRECLKIGHWTQDGNMYEQCIPYEGNEHLVGTTNNPE